jgi:MoaA/NifB/PqqE/SkfB family radical SAM enzyme
VEVESFPFILFIEPLYYCNLHCPLCPRETSPDARHGKSAAGRLSLDLFDKILDEIGDYLFQCQIFGNGEPLLDWPRTRHVVSKAHSRGIFTLISTNATLLTADMAAELVASGLDYLICAIDGTSPESYEKYRIGGELEAAMNGLRMLVDERRKQRSRITLEWQFLVNRFNMHEMASARKIAADLGVFLRFSPMGVASESSGSADYWVSSDAQWQSEIQTPIRPRRKFHCYWLWRSLAINSNGQLGRCPGYSNIAQLGSLYDNSIMSIYNGPTSQRARELFSKSNVREGDFPWPCTNCSHFDRHRGGPNLPITATSRPMVSLPVV